MKARRKRTNHLVSDEKVAMKGVCEEVIKQAGERLTVITNKIREILREETVFKEDAEISKHSSEILVAVNLSLGNHGGKTPTPQILIESEGKLFVQHVKDLKAPF